MTRRTSRLKTVSELSQYTMSEVAAATVGDAVPIQDPKNVDNTKAGEANGHVASSEAIMERYRKEREKRLRADGMAQYVDPGMNDKFNHFQVDPWVTPETKNPGFDRVKSGDRVKVLIVGAGFGGMLFAARLLDAGIDDFVIADTAGGFGGTWYWNRYPGLMCDVESYVYLPLLEETGYIPKQKYSDGYEIRLYAESIALRYNLAPKAILQTKVDSMSWDDTQGEWKVNLSHVRGPKAQFTVNAEIVISSTGILNLPKMADLPGVLDYKGKSFHTARWDYGVTGGTQADPSLVNLKDKRVGILGTGLTAVQAIPHLAKWAKELYVFQRTPSAVDFRNNKVTDVEWFKKEVAGSGKGWQRRRGENFNSYISDSPDGPDMVKDEWTKMRTFSILVGKPGPITDIPAYVANARAIDLPRQERIRKRVDDTVKDKETAENLKPWYAGWCKRPAFHDGYLETYNQPNVHLVDTDGKGVDKVTTDGFVVAGKDYPLDVLIFSTGFYTPAGDSPAVRANTKIYGRGGVSLDDRWKEKISTLHGIVTKDFPNLLFPGPNQAGGSANAVYTLDLLSEHIAWLLAKAKKRSKNGKLYIEPEDQAMEDWAKEIVSRASIYAPMAGCTPGYLNNEGAADKPKTLEETMKGARGAMWGEGVASYIERIAQWRADGKLEGLRLSHTAPAA